MAHQTNEDIWRVQTPDGISETDLATLKSWIHEGIVMPGDKVAKGKLGWLDAGRVPALRRAFSGEEALEMLLANDTAPEFAAPPQMPENSPAAPAAFARNVPPARHEPRPTAALTALDYTPVPPPGTYTPGPERPALPPPPAHLPPPQYTAPPRRAAPPSSAPVCFRHADQMPQYICSACGTLQCRACARHIGTVALCGDCGEMCRDYVAVVQKVARQRHKAQGFGLTDWGLALLYPFKGGLAILFAALLYAALYVAGMVTWIFSMGLLFGYVSRTIRQVAVGRWAEGSATHNHDFNFFEDVVAPFGRGLSVLAVSFGPLVILVFMVFTGLVGKYDRAAELDKKNQESLYNEAAMRQALDRGRPEEIAEATKKVRAEIDGKVTSVNSKSDAEMSGDVFRQVRQNSTPGLMVCGALALLWATFYYPLALMVSGYTESALATLNPLLGLDTMRHLGADYLKVFAMYLALMVLGGLFSALAFHFLAPFDLPIVGNVLGRFVDGIISFYTNLAVACLLGLLLYKCADRLGLATD